MIRFVTSLRLAVTLMWGSCLLFAPTLAFGEEAAVVERKGAGTIVIHRYWEHLSEEDPRLSSFLTSLATDLNSKRPNEPALRFSVETSIADQRLERLLKAKRSIEEQEKSGWTMIGYNVTVGLFLTDLCSRHGWAFEIEGYHVIISTGVESQTPNHDASDSPADQHESAHCGLLPFRAGHHRTDPSDGAQLDRLKFAPTAGGAAGDKKIAAAV